MLKAFWYHIIFTIVIVLVTLSNSHAAGYPGFRELNENDCVVLGEKDIQRLPPAWHKYKGFIKNCGLKKNKSLNEKVSVISIWTDDYLNTLKTKMWENFPLTIIVDNHFNQLGTFPERYPMDFRTEPIVYYGKWKSGMPTEIRIDVYNPTVSGDYYYAPLIWNEKDGQYHMKTKETKHGKRPK